MRKSRFTEEQMVKILREADKSPVAEVAKKYGLSSRRELHAGARTCAQCAQRCPALGFEQ